MFESLFSRFKRSTIVKESDEDLSLDEKNVINEIKDFMASKRRKDARFLVCKNSVRNLLAQIAETASMTRER